MFRVAPVLALASLLESAAWSGEIEVDLEVAVMGWADEPSSNDRFYVRKWVGQSFSQDEITEAEFGDLVEDAGTSCTAFASTATSILGSWYTSLDTDGRTKLCHLFEHIADSD